MRGWALIRNQRGSPLCTPRLLRSGPPLTSSEAVQHLLPRSRHNQTLSYRPIVNHVVHAETTRSGDRFSLGFSLPIPKTLDITSWLEQLDAHLPWELRQPLLEDVRSQGMPVAQPFLIGTVARILHNARSTSKLDLLAHLGLEKGRWDKMLWIMEALIDLSAAPQALWDGTTSLSTLDWPQNLSLANLTVGSFSLGNQSNHPLASGETLNNIASSDLGLHKEFADTASGGVIGDLWQSLARLIIEAEKRNSEESQFIMAKVVGVLSRLHQRGFIPPSISALEPEGLVSSAPRAQAFKDSYSQMLEHLAEITKMMQSDSSVTTQLSPLDVSSAGHADACAGIGEHLWLELILWSCVEGQWLLEGASILGEMKETRRLPGGPPRWQLKSWREKRYSVAASRKSQVRQLQRLMKEKLRRRKSVAEHSRPAADNGRPVASLDTTASRDELLAPENRVSAEVVVALVHGLVAASAKSGKYWRHSMRTILDKLNVLKAMLDRNGLSLGTTTWDAILTRFAESPGIVEPERNPRLMADALELAEVHGTEATSDNGLLTPGIKHLDSAAASIFEGSSAVIALYHRTLLAYVQSRDANGAIRLLQRLQSYTDAHKQRSLEHFFEKLHSTSSRAIWEAPDSLIGIESNDSEAMFPEARFTSLFPAIPVGTLAELLDLLVESGNLDVAYWMVHSKDVDGPLITEAMYGNQAIAPSLIRFAAETNDKELLLILRRAQTNSVSGRTLVALCDNRIRRGDFDAAEEILTLVEEYSLHKWDVCDFTSLLKSLLLQIYGRNDSRDFDSATSRRATILFQGLIRGTFGEVWGASLYQLDAVVAIVASLDPYLAQLSSGVTTHHEERRCRLPASSFNHLLKASVHIWGSPIGKKMYGEWCSDEPLADSVDAGETYAPSKAGRPRLNLAEQFSVPTEDGLAVPDPAQRKGRVHERIAPNLATIRVVLQAALDELRGAESKNNQASAAANRSTSDDVLRWAAGILRENYSLSDAEIDYELQGHSLSSDEPEQPETQDYSAQTLRIWRVLEGPRRHWALQRELDLRALTANRSERQIIFQNVPPTEKSLLQCLSADYGLATEIIGGVEGIHVKIFKAKATALRIPEETLDDVFDHHM